jgi:hypothetical protein
VLGWLSRSTATDEGVGVVGGTIRISGRAGEQVDADRPEQLRLASAT